MRLLIDPGHGGSDQGASANGIVEAELVLDLALELEEALAEMRWPVDVTLTRGACFPDPDGRLSLGARARIGKEARADLVLSIHANANASPSPHGLMAFHWPGSHLGKAVADAIDAATPAPLRHPSDELEARRETWPRVRNVLQVHGAPAVLVEVGFVTNAGDAALLKRPGIRRELVVAMLAGVARAIALTVLEPVDE